MELLKELTRLMRKMKFECIECLIAEPCCYDCNCCVEHCKCDRDMDT